MEASRTRWVRRTRSPTLRRLRRRVVCLSGQWQADRRGLARPPDPRRKLRQRAFAPAGARQGRVARRERPGRLEGVRRPERADPPAARGRGAVAGAPAAGDDVPAALAVQNQLSQVQLDLEQARGRLQYLDNRVAFATISMSMHELGVVPPRTAASRSSLHGRLQARRSSPSSAGSSSGSPSPRPCSSCSASASSSAA